MRNLSLLDRQTELLRHLTDAEILFGSDRPSGLAREPSLYGLSLPHLRLEAELSFRKRMANIGKVFRRTYLYLGDQQAKLFYEFARACPPGSGRRIEEA